ncbi:TPA: hypothetical protein N3288_000227 [Klebsiella aerogenes]|nr:hypothetical protein [Klebsiella aerogenes]
MAYSIVIPDRDWSEQQVSLDGSVYTIELRYRGRLDRWYLTLKDMSGNILVNQKKCVCGQTLTGTFSIPGFVGSLYVEQRFGVADYPTRNNFGQGKEIELLYLTEKEFSLLLRVNDMKNINVEDVIEAKAQARA